MRIDFLPEAEKELEAASDWYLIRSQSASVRFATAVDEALRQIHADPQRFGVTGAKWKHRACPVEGFPYQIIFRIDPHRLLVVAVAHAKRRPGYWRKRH